MTKNQNTRNPFPGLRPFEASESDLFFGRERHISQILSKLKSNRFVSVVGNSGSGKSSLVKAGILPQLQKEETPWIITTTNPGDSAIQQLCHALIQVSNSTSINENEILAHLHQSERGLIQVYRELFGNSEQPLFILVDQFEELFRYRSIDKNNGQKEAMHFVNLILTAISQREVPIYVMLTLRSDFLGDCEQFLGLPEAINDGQFLVPRMTADDLKRSLTGPVQLVKGKIAPRLVQRLVDEVDGNPDQLPVLQHVMMRTWEVWMAEKNSSQPMDIAHYEKTGGMQNALSKHAEEAYLELISDDDRLATKALFKCLTVKGNNDKGIRRPTSVEKISQIIGVKEEKVIAIVDVFRRADRGFLMPSQNIPLSSKSVIDISHESLMRVWHKLKIWVDEEAQSAELYLRLVDSAHLYEENKAGLWRNPDLQIALDWKNKNAPNEYWAQQYDRRFSLAMRFLEASKNDRKFFLAEKTRRRKMTTVVLLIFLLALSILSIWTIGQRNKSVENEKLALKAKQKADTETLKAKHASQIAEANLQKFKDEQGKVAFQTKQTEEQRAIAEQMEQRAQKAKSEAQKATILANEAKAAALLEQDKTQVAQKKSIVLLNKADSARKAASKLQMLSIAQNLAIKSSLMEGSNDSALQTKTLLALYAHKFNSENGGNPQNPIVFEALQSALNLQKTNAEKINKFHSDEVKTIAFQPNSNQILSAGNDGKICLAQNGNLNQQKSSKGISKIITKLAFNSDGSQIAITTGNQLLVFNSKNLDDPIFSLDNHHSSQIMDIGWYESLVITIGLDKKIKLWDFEKNQLAKEFLLSQRLLSLAISNTMKMMLIGDDQGGVYQLNLETLTSPKLKMSVKNDRIDCLAISTNGLNFALGTFKGYAAVFQTKNNQLISRLNGHQAKVTGIAFNPKNQNQLASSCLDGLVRLWQLDGLNPQPVVFANHNSWVWGVVFNQEGDKLASCSKDKTVMVYNISLPSMLKELHAALNGQQTMSQEEWSTYVGKDVAYLPLL